MSQMDTNNCDCNDYSLLVANTGIATISTANSHLDGTGTIATVLTAGSNGTIIKSIIIKSIAPLVNGMVRLYIGTSNASAISLYREIPIPIYPDLASTPTPAPIWPMLEIDLIEGFKLNSGFKLYASTQNAQSFNIIAEGLDWKYPGTLPFSCCNFKQETAVTGLGSVSAANTNLNGQGTIVTVYTAPNNTNGSLIKSITLSALQSTNKGMVRFFISHDGTNFSLMMEVYIPESIQSGFTPSFKQLLDVNFYLKAGYVIGATTQNAESFAITVEGEDWTYPIS